LLDLNGANGSDWLLEILEYKEIKVTLVLLDLMVQMELIGLEQLEYKEIR
jgi:hypothetical protein